ncbi:DUF5777 family beta-barrel protein [Schleiferiaceae bacterium]|jgi:hypothetical protein|nr:DUF5777 family beta-barrel protein [Schleiferiaceae bacterium]
MRQLFFLGLILLGSSLRAQDDLMAELELLAPAPTKSYSYATFKGTRVINQQSIELPGKGVGQFVIGHRFGALNDRPLYNLFGLDVAQIRFEYSYSPYAWLNVGAGRSSGSKTYDTFAKIRFLRQSSGAGWNSPVSMAYYTSATLVTTPFSDGFDHYFTDRLAYTHQVLVARKFTDALSLQLSPTLVHFNLVPTVADANDQWALSFAGRYKLTQRMALTAEYMLNLNAVDGYHNSGSIGLDIETGGHVFQFHLTNSRSMADPQWMMQTPGQWSRGDIFLGFNITRVFTHVRP